jgi:hypothetical protein
MTTMIAGARSQRLDGDHSPGPWHIPLFDLPTGATQRIPSNHGVLFVTYGMLISKGSRKTEGATRLRQILLWCGADTGKANPYVGILALYQALYDGRHSELCVRACVRDSSTSAFDGVIVLDEGHMAKNLQPDKANQGSKTGQMVQQLQDLLPMARIVYVSATGATEPRNMAYMSRLGLWNNANFPTFDDFNKRYMCAYYDDDDDYTHCQKRLLTRICCSWRVVDWQSSIEAAGVAAMEMVAMEMKRAGMYCSRNLSFHGTVFDIHKHELTANERRIYDEAAQYASPPRCIVLAVTEVVTFAYV